MKNNKYKIVIFTDLKESMDTNIKSAINLAKMINGEIELLHVKKALDVVNKESQLSAMRNISSKYVAAENKLKSIVSSFSKDYDIPLSYTLTFGNLKNEISSYLEEKKPDIVVLGKKKSKLSNKLRVDSIQFILKKHNGPIFITDNEICFDLNNDLSLGVLNDIESFTKYQFTEDLLERSKKPIKSFKILNDSNKAETAIANKSTVEFIFDKSDNVMQNISKFVSKSNLNLVCLNRNTTTKPLKINDIIENLNVPVLLME
ncbi:universal stress protein [Aurantibacter sp.]|uniref:universal stress protein n=1 Tax=Aurantibacter sp. TaxID=2807103 RepID=UPI003266CEF6